MDPTSEDGKELVEYVKLFLDHMVPARLGVLLVPQENTEVGVALCQGFSYLAVQESPRRALAWLYKVCCVLCVRVIRHHLSVSTYMAKINTQ